MKCNSCNQPAKYYHCNHNTGIHENLCKYHYSKWHPTFLEEEINKMKKCFICGDMAIVIEHHIFYLPQKKIFVCGFCHKQIHKTKKHKNLLPPKQHIEIFYAKKGVITKNSYPFFIRKLTEEEKILRKQMQKGKVVFL